MIRERLSIACIVGLLLLAAPGCKKDKSDEGPRNESEKQQATELKFLLLHYHSAFDRENAPPMNKEQFNLEGGHGGVDFSRYVIIWGVNFSDVADPKNTVLAYVADVPTNGGMVGFVDGSVRRVTAEDFGSLPKATPVKMADRAVDISLSVKEFSKDFAKYDGKIVELRGIITGFESSSDFDPPQSFNDRVVLGSGEFGHFAHGIMSEPQTWTKYSKGQQITIKGRRGGGVGRGNPQLTECVVVAAGPNTGQVTTAEALAKEAADDASGAAARFENKSLVLSGEVIRQEGDRFSRKIVLQGDGKSTLTCKFKGSGRERTKVFKPSEKVKFYAEFQRIDAGNIVLEKCQLIID